VAERDAEAVRQHDEPCGNRLAVGQRQLLPVLAGFDADHLGKGHFGRAAISARIA
jgi:hypothetical protein